MVSHRELLGARLSSSIMGHADSAMTAGCGDVR